MSGFFLKVSLNKSYNVLSVFGVWFADCRNEAEILNYDTDCLFLYDEYIKNITWTLSKKVKNMIFSQRTLYSIPPDFNTYLQLKHAAGWRMSICITYYSMNLHTFPLFSMTCLGCVLEIHKNSSHSHRAQFFVSLLQYPLIFVFSSSITWFNLSSKQQVVFCILMT